MPIIQAYFVLYVTDKARTAAYYRKVLDREPIVDTSSITEFELHPACVLAIMQPPEAEKLLGLPTAPLQGGAAREELYLLVDDPDAFHHRALESGGRELSPLRPRKWGHLAAYSIDPDGHVLGFAKKMT
jgi:hypothetical protein